MKKTIILHPSDCYGKNIKAEYSKKEQCLRCHNSFIVPLNHGVYSFVSYHGTDHYNVYLSAHCPNCDQISFIEFLKITPSPLRDINEPGLYEFINLDLYQSSIFPHAIPPCTFDENIKSISPRFIQIYQQSLYAEQLGLNEICLTGYRKALEFLIKDYLINFCHNKKAHTMKLHEAIEALEFMEMTAPATVVRLAANNWTHYEEKDEPYNIKDAKPYLFAVANYISIQMTKNASCEKIPQTVLSKLVAKNGEHATLEVSDPAVLADTASEIDNDK